MAKEEVVHVRVSTEEKKLIEQDAQEQDRTVSNFLLWCWKQWRKEKEVGDGPSKETKKRK